MLYKEILEAYKRVAKTLHGICLAGSRKFGVISSLRDTPGFSEYRLNEMQVGGDLRLNDSILSSFLSLHFLPPDVSTERAKTIICFVSSPHDIDIDRAGRILEKKTEESVTIIFILLDQEYDEEMRSILENVSAEENQCCFYAYHGQDPRSFAQGVVRGSPDDGYVPPLLGIDDEELRRVIELSKSEY